MTWNRAVVLASLPQCCLICKGDRQVGLGIQWPTPDSPISLASPPVPCPHCIDGIPIVHLPHYVDRKAS